MVVANKKSVLVIGGSTPNSIGSAIAERLRWMGHKAFAPGPEFLNVVTHDSAQIERTIRTYGLPDAVVYSVGVNELEWSYKLERESFERLMTVNVWGFVNVLQALQSTKVPYSVLAVTSDAAVRPMRTSMAYCASKAALNQVIRVASREMAFEGWRINGIAPGKVEGTEMTRYVDETVLQLRAWTKEHAEAYELASSPIGRKLWPAEIAAAACDILLSDAAGWTGDIISVNGGR